MGVEKFLTRSGFAVLFAALLPHIAFALPGSGAGGQGGAWSTVIPAQLYNPGLALAPGFSPFINNFSAAYPGWGTPNPAPAYHSVTAGAAFAGTEEASLLSFDTPGYDVMWDDTKFSEIAAYGGLERDALRVAGMRAIDGTNGASGAFPYGRLTLRQDFLDGRHQLMLGAYGTQASVRQTAITGFGDDSYTDVALDGTWRWIAHPGRSTSDMISAHVLALHEDENLIASHAIFGTRKNDGLTMFRGDVSWSRGGNFVPVVQYFQISGSSDPVRLGTLDGSPASKGFIGEIDYLPSDDARSPLNWFNIKLSLQVIAYSEFDGSSRDASQNNTVLLHLTAETDPAA